MTDESGDESIVSPKPKHFATLGQGWHFGSGGPIDQRIIDLAAQVIRRLGTYGLTRTDVFPNEDGAVLVTAYHRDHYVSIAVNPDETYDLNHEFGGEEVQYEEGLSREDLDSALARVSETIEAHGLPIDLVKLGPDGFFCRRAPWVE